jgi:hypothetical protein
VSRQVEFRNQRKLIPSSLDNIEKVQKNDDRNGNSDEPKQDSAHELLLYSLIFFDADLTSAAEQSSALFQYFFHSWNTIQPNAFDVEWRP